MSNLLGVKKIENKKEFDEKTTKSRIENTQRNNFLQNLEINTDPFSKLLRDENMKRINIDEKLQPYFKNIIIKIRNYFIKNDLMYVKNYDEFFSEYLFDSKLTIRLASKDELPVHARGKYEKDKNQILISEGLVSPYVLCHEFIHFLVMADSNKLNWCPSQINFINEGYTELLVSEINNIFPQAYIENVNMIKFLNLFSKNKNEAIKAFLKDKFAFGDEYMWTDINRYSENIDTNSYRSIQRKIISTLIDNSNINSNEDYIQIINILKQRPSFDKKYMEEYFMNLNKRFLENINLSTNERIMKLLNRYCSASYKAQVFGDREVVEFDFDDISGSFDINGEVYGDFPNGGVTSFSTQYIELVHNKKKQRYSLEGLEGTNWVNEFDKAKEELYTFFNYKEKDNIIR